MKLFQIEEPDGSPADPDASGAAIGIDITGGEAQVAVAVGGNAAMLGDREGFALDLAVPPANAPTDAWRSLFEGARLRAERALGRPVTHAVVVVAVAANRAEVTGAAEVAGIVLLRIVARSELASAEDGVLGAAILAEELAPRPAAP